MEIKQIVKTLVLLTFLSIMTFSSIPFVRAQTDEDSIDLDYGESLGFQADVENNIVWEFKSSDDVGITVFVLDEDNIKKYKDNEPFEADIESDGDKTEDSGEYEIADPGKYMIMFFNNDSSMKTTTVDYKVTFDAPAGGAFFIYALFFVIIAIIAVVVVVVIIVVVRKQNKKKREMGARQLIYSPQMSPQPYGMQPPTQMGPYPPPQFQPVPLPAMAPVPAAPSTAGGIFCPHCRAKISNPNAAFCSECGANLKA